MYKYLGKNPIHLRKGTSPLAAKSMGVMETKSTSSELGRGWKTRRINRKGWIQQAQSKAEEPHPEKLGLVHPLQSAQSMNWLLQTKRKVPTWTKLNFWDQILFPPPILGTIGPVLRLWLKEQDRYKEKLVFCKCLWDHGGSSFAWHPPSSTRYFVPSPKGSRQIIKLLQNQRE